MFTRQQDMLSTGRLQALGITAALLLIPGVAGCTAPESTTAAAPADEAREVQPMPIGEVELEAGTYLVDAFSVPFEVTVPEGWTTHGWLLIHEDADQEAAFVTFLRAKAVPTEACNWSGTFVEIGSSIDSFADAVAAQSSTTTTAPVDIAVSGFDAIEFDIAVDRGVDFATCDSGHVCIHSESAYHCTRYYHEDVGRHETYRVVDLDGERAIISMGQDRRTPSELVDEAQAIFDSITFVTD